MKSISTVMAFSTLLAAGVLSGYAVAQSGAVDMVHSRMEPGCYPAALFKLEQCCRNVAF